MLRLMTDEELVYAKKFLDYVNVDYSGDVILLNSGGNGIIMNQSTKWQEYLGISINQIAESVAKKLDKKIEWEDESY
jgi:hypothetical protein